MEQGHSEGRVAVTGAPDHALENQAGSERSKRIGALVEDVRYVTRPMWTLAQLCHGPQVLLLLGGEPVEANPEETFVERGDRFARSLPNVAQPDRA